MPHATRAGSTAEIPTTYTARRLKWARYFYIRPPLTWPSTSKRYSFSLRDKLAGSFIACGKKNRAVEKRADYPL